MERERKANTDVILQDTRHSAAREFDRLLETADIIPPAVYSQNYSLCARPALRAPEGLEAIECPASSFQDRRAFTLPFSALGRLA